MLLLLCHCSLSCIAALTAVAAPAHRLLYAAPLLLSSRFVFFFFAQTSLKDLLYPVDPDTEVADISGGPATGVWLLRTSVDVENGVLMEVIGTATTGGDADRVRCFLPLPVVFSFSFSLLSIFMRWPVS